MVFAGGDFTKIGGQNRNHLAALSSETSYSPGGYAFSWNPDANGSVNALAVPRWSNIVYAGGEFTSIGGKERRGLAQMSVSQGISDEWNPGANKAVRTLSLPEDNSKIYVGGDLSSAGGLPRRNLAALDAATGAATDWTPPPLEPVYALTNSDSKVFAATDYNIKALDNETSAVAWSCPISGRYVSSMTVLNSTIYIGGYFEGYFAGYDGPQRNHLAALDAQTGAVTDWNPNPNGDVHSLKASGSTIFVGGGFSKIGGKASNGIVALDPVTGTAKDWGGALTGGARAMTLSGSILHAIGDFQLAGGGTARYNFAVVDPATGNAAAWNPGLDYYNGEFTAFGNALVASGSTILVSGLFSRIGGQDRSYLAQLDARTHAVAAWAPQPNSLASALVLQDSALYVGGYFTNISSQDRWGLARYDVLSYDVAFQTDGTRGATLTGPVAQVVKPGDGCTPVTAIAPAGYRFVKWTLDGQDYSSANTPIVTHVTSDMTFVANFEEHNMAQDWALYDR